MKEQNIFQTQLLVAITFQEKNKLTFPVYIHEGQVSCITEDALKDILTQHPWRMDMTGDLKDHYISMYEEVEDKYYYDLNDILSDMILPITKIKFLKNKNHHEA